MKEAAGEANLTVVAIILIAVIVAIATPLIGSLMDSASNKSCCTDAGGVWKGGGCTEGGSGMYDTAGYSTCIANANVNKSSS